MLFKEIFDIEFNCADNRSLVPLACRQRRLNGTVLRTRPQKPRRCIIARQLSLFTGHWCRRMQPLTAMVSIRCHNIVLFGGWGGGGDFAGLSRYKVCFPSCFCTVCFFKWSSWSLSDSCGLVLSLVHLLYICKALSCIALWFGLWK